ncbi:MAG: periplasmic heavy metal sensor [Desulfoprunum sp.]|nr:periplasmic heavy metal sensor [Desulfoprunum sp.]
MKKKIAAIALVLSLATVGIASARGGMGGGMGMGVNCPQAQGQQMNQQLDKATQDKLDAFQRDTQALRKQIIMKHAEMRAMMQSDNPNPAAASKLSGELFDLQATMQDKAKAAGVATYLGGGCGMGMGRGGMMGGQGGGRGMMGSRM